MSIFFFFRDECKSQVDKFPYASYKRFAAEKDAWAFVRSLATSITPDLSEGRYIRWLCSFSIGRYTEMAIRWVLMLLALGMGSTSNH